MTNKNENSKSFLSKKRPTIEETLLDKAVKDSIYLKEYAEVLNISLDQAQKNVEIEYEARMEASWL